MDQHEEKIRENMQRKLNEKFKDVELFSEEHKRDIDKFSRLLDKLKTEQTSNADRRAVVEVQDILSSFSLYAERFGITLSENETREIMAITGARFTPVVKKRMIEDVIYRIKQRDQQVRKARQEQDQIELEINEIKAARGFVAKWLALTRFALDYGSITIFSHQTKDSALKIFREKVFIWQELLQTSVKGIMDNEYYTLSILEYNALELILKLEKPVRDIFAIRREAAYSPKKIAEQMDAFSSIYVSILKNSLLIENTLRKVSSQTRLDHGIIGVFGDLTDQPIFNNKPVQWNFREKMKNGIFGSLVSYYTSREGTVLKSINQIAYLVSASTELDQSEKHLTPEARRLEESQQEKKFSEDEKFLERYQEIERIERFINNGRELEIQMLKSEARNQYQAWAAENLISPVLRIKRLVDGFINYFVNYINDENAFVLIYDNNDYRNYFEIKQEIINISSHYNMLELDLTGTKSKEILGIRIHSGADPSEYLRTLLKADLPLTESNPVISFAKSTLNKISEKSYSFALRLNELISYYYSQKGISHGDVKYNFDFFLNARLRKSRSVTHQLLLKTDELSLKDFLESACSLAFLISHELLNAGIENLIKERNQLKAKIDAIKARKNSIVDINNELAKSAADIDFNDEIIKKVDEMYKDKISGLRNREYLEDEIIAKFYDSDRKFKFTNLRFIILLNIDSFKLYNDKYSHDTGDRVLAGCAGIFDTNISALGDDRNFSARYDGTTFIGIINNKNNTSVIDIARKIKLEIESISIMFKGKSIGSIGVSMAIYHDTSDNSIDDNIEIARRLLAMVIKRGGSSIAFIKDHRKIVTKREYAPNNEIDQSLVSYIN